MSYTDHDLTSHRHTLGRYLKASLRRGLLVVRTICDLLGVGTHAGPPQATTTQLAQQVEGGGCSCGSSPLEADTAPPELSPTRCHWSRHGNSAGGTTIGPTAVTMRVCAEPGCPVLSRNRRCPAHAAQYERDRGTRQQRGYDAQHEATRAALLPKAYGTLCPIGGPTCVGYMYPHHELHLDHSTPLAVDSTSRGDRIVCAPCNLAWRARHSE